jgi:hypothetical protein
VDKQILIFAKLNCGQRDINICKIKLWINRYICKIKNWKERLKNSWLEEVFEGGEGPHRTVVSSKKRWKKKRRRSVLIVSRIRSQ